MTRPDQLKDKDGLKLYHKLNKVTRVRHDPYLANTLMATEDFVNDGKAKPWCEFTQHRKKLL